MTLSHDDRMLLQRHLDGALDRGASAAFAARATAEPELAQALEAERALRIGFAAARGEARRAPATFTANVLAAVRRLPSRELLEQQDVAAHAVRLCRRLLLAAAVIAGLGLVWQSGLVHTPAAAPLQASPGDVLREIERLDALPTVESRRPR
jgi:hypothetical protein